MCLGLGRIRQLVVADGLSCPEAVEAVRAGCIFTTHTPVPAGIDRFTVPLMDRYFGAWCKEVGVGLDDLLALGRRPTDDDDEPFNMAVMGLRLAGRSNGVAKLHGAVSRDMFGDLWPDLGPDEAPIGSVTNGVHAHTWTSPEISDVLSRHVLPNWVEADDDQWDRVAEIPDDELWRAREQARRDAGLGGVDGLRLLSAAETRERLGVSRVEGGLYTPHCARVHPGRLVRGLARGWYRWAATGFPLSLTAFGTNSRVSWPF